MLMASPIRDKIRSADILSSFWQCLYICIACTRRCTADSIANCNNSCSRCRQKKKTESYNCAPQRPLRPSPYHLLDGNTHRVSNHCLEKNKRKKHITRTRVCIVLWSYHSQALIFYSCASMWLRLPGGSSEMIFLTCKRCCLRSASGAYYCTLSSQRTTILYIETTIIATMKRWRLVFFRVM